MGKWFQSNPVLGSAVGGAIFALILFMVPGRAAVSPVNVVLAVLLGAAFAAAMYRSLRARRPPST
jgi:glucose uptake protein GlcU